MMTALAFDPGFGNTKLFGERGGLVIASAVAVGQVAVTARMAGLRSARPPLRVETESGAFGSASTRTTGGGPWRTSTLIVSPVLRR